MTSEQTDEAEDTLATLANMRKYAHVAHVAYCTGPTGRHLLTADEAKDMLANSPFRVWQLSDDVEILDENEVQS